MRHVTKHVFLSILIIGFIYIAYMSVFSRNVVKEAFGGVYYAKDCSCELGYLPQLCGDQTNAKHEKMSDKCEAGTYFCQSLTPPYTRVNCGATNNHALK